MSYPVYYVPAGDVLPIFFDTFDGGTGASVTMTGLAVTDIEIYRDGGVTQRASDAGYTLLDTDGIDFDAITGIHGFSIDTGDNTDASFYVVGAWYHVVVSAITVDAQTVNFVAAAFRIMEAETTAGRVQARVAAIANDAITAASIATNAIDADAMADGAITAATFAAGAIDATAIANGAIDAATFAAGAIDATAIADGAITAAKIADAAIDAATFATTAGSFYPLGVVDQGTAQSATATTLVLRAAAAFADDELIGATILLTGGTGAGQSRLITDYVSATDTATVETWTTTPSGTITYKIFGTAPGAAGSGLDAAGVRAAVGLATANLDTQLAAIEAQTDDIGIAGAGLTAVPWNAAWDAEVQSEVADALDADIPAVPTAGSVNDVLNDLDARLPASGTIATATNVAAVETDTQDIQARLPAALNNGAILADVQRINDVEIVGDGSATPFDVL